MEVSVVRSMLSSCRGLARAQASLAASNNRRGKHHDTDRSTLHQNKSLSTQSCVKQLNDGGKEGLYRRQPHLPVYSHIENHRKKIAISDVHGDYLYEDVYMRSWDLAKGIIGMLSSQEDSQTTGRRICFLCPHGLTHVITSWACWMSGNVAVPLCPSSDPARLEHLIVDSKCSVVVTTKDQVDRVHSITKQHSQKLIVLDETWWVEPKQESEDQETPLPAAFVDPELHADTNALILYTAGATGIPKGVVLTHSILGHQVERVVDAWDWTSSDSVLHSLSLGQVYGLINSLQAPLSTGARVTFMPVFDPNKVWSYLLGVGVRADGPVSDKINCFPGVPSMYLQLLNKADELFKDKKTRDYVKTTCTKRMRLMMSSTATLPPSIVQQWKNATGHRVLENFISTEAGTALCNRVAGSGLKPGPGCQDCGAPTSKTETQIVKFRDHTKSKYDVLARGSDAGTQVLDAEDGERVVGELLLRGPGVARSYWVGGKEEDIDMSDGWFGTGDIIEYNKGCYKVRGRLGVSNISQKGELVNGAGVEKKLLSCPLVSDCYVVGLGDVGVDQRVGAVLVLNLSSGDKVSLEIILDWCQDNMVGGDLPTVFRLVESIARDSNGHVDKLKLGDLFAEEPVLCFYDSKL